MRVKQRPGDEYAAYQLSEKAFRGRNGELNMCLTLYSVFDVKLGHGQEPFRFAQLMQAMERLRDMGILMGKGGFYGNVFRIKPPMCFSMADADFLADAMDIAFSEL